MTEAQRYLGLFDILGFSRIVELNLLPDVISAVRSFLQHAAMAQTFIADLRTANLISFHVFSDTLLIYSQDDTIQAYGDLIKFSQLLIGMSFNKGLLLRGAITHGEVFVDGNIIVGKPIVRAYQMEQAQEWVGCWLEDECVESLQARYRAAMEDYQFLHYPIPLKSGTVQNRWALNWVFAAGLKEGVSLDDAARERFVRFTGQTQLSWDAQRKLDNTVSFLRHAETKMKPPPKRRLNSGEAGSAT